MIYCANHGIRHADFHCPTCEFGLCKECIAVKDFGRAKAELCPRCGNPVTNLDEFKAVQPFWQRIPELLAWPIMDEAWMYLVAWAVFSFFILGAIQILRFLPSGGFGFAGVGIFSGIYYGTLVGYFYRIINNSEEGNFKVPDWGAFKGIGGTAYLAGRFFIACLAVFWPMGLIIAATIAITAGTGAEGSSLLFLPLSLPFMIIAGIAGYILLPMALLIMGLSGNLAYVVNPLYLGAQISKIAKEYFIALAIITGFVIAYILANTFFALVIAVINTPVKYFFILPLNGVFHLYMAMVIGHLLGYMAYQTRYKLKLWDECQHEPIFMIGGKPTALDYAPSSPAHAGPSNMPAAGAAMTAAAGAAVAGVAGAAAVADQFGGSPGMPDQDLPRMLNDGMSMLDHGRFEDARSLFDSVLEQNPTHLGALRGAIMASIRLEDVEGLKNYTATQGEELAKQQSFEVMWEGYSEIKKKAPDFCFTMRPQLAMANWLAGQNQPLDAAKALREVAIANPDDPAAPKALYQCADLLWKRCDKGETAAQMFAYIQKRYPTNAFSDLISAALAELKPSQ